MTIPELPLRQRIAEGHRLAGLLVRVPATMLIDMAGNHGYDFVLLDTEHGIADQRDIGEHIVTARAAGLPVLVRIGEGEAALALRVLDAGAAGIVVPHVRSAQEAETAVRSAHYPPRGDRGFATYTSAGRWGRTGPRQHAADAADRTVVIVMIEDLAGVAAAPEIARVEGVDVVWVGPGDLAASLGHDVGAAGEAQRQVWRHAAAARTPVLAIVSDAPAARAAYDAGAQLVVLNTQSAIDHCLADWSHGARPATQSKAGYRPG